MADVLIIGDGPGGLSAALFLAKNDMAVTVFGQNKTFMHDAMLLRDSSDNRNRVSRDFA